MGGNEGEGDRMRQLIAGNWKMNGLRAEGLALARAVRDGAAGLGCELADLSAGDVAVWGGRGFGRRGTVMLGAQDCHPDGERSAHRRSQRDDVARRWGGMGDRWPFGAPRRPRGERSDRAGQRRSRPWRQRLVPIICVGETEQHRNSGMEEVVVASQLDGSLPAGIPGSSGL